MNNKKNIKFVNYTDGAKRYGMRVSDFQRVAEDAKACYKLNRLSLVNTKIVDEYLEQFVSYAKGAEIYGMVESRFQQVVKDAKARHKLGRLVLVDTKIVDTYLEQFHIA